MICEATPTMFLEPDTSFSADGSGNAFADAVIHSINKKPEKKECH